MADGTRQHRDRCTALRAAVVGLVITATVWFPAASAWSIDTDAPPTQASSSTSAPDQNRPVLALAGACPNVPYGDGGATEEHREPGEAYFGTPPNPDGPTLVDVGVFVEEVTEVNPVDNTFRIEGYLDVVWCDPREGFNPARAGSAEKIFLESAAQREVAQSWSPELTLVNEVEAREIQNEELALLPDGTTEYREKFAAQLEAVYDFTRFPFDHQILEVELESFTWTADQVRLIERSDMVGFSDEFQIPDWNTRSVTSQVATVQEDRDRSRFSEFTVSIGVDRQFHFYLWKILMPLVLMVAVSWSVFWMTGEDLSSRVGVSFTGILTVVAYQFIMGDTLPKVTYVTLWDAVLTLSFVLMALTIAENVVVHALRTRHTQRDVAAIDRTSRWLFPTTYLLGLLGLAALYLA